MSKLEGALGWLGQAGLAFTADLFASKASHAVLDRQQPPKNAGEAASRVAQATILRPTVHARARIKEVQMRTKTHADGDVAIRNLLQHQVNRAQQLKRPYGDAQPYGAAAETQMWHAFDVLCNGIEDNDVLDLVFLWMCHLPPEEFDAEIESLIDNVWTQRLRQAIEMAKIVIDALNQGAEFVAEQLRGANDLLAELRLTQRGAQEHDDPPAERFRRMFSRRDRTPNPQGDAIAQRLAVLKARRQTP